MTKRTVAAFLLLFISGWAAVPSDKATAGQFPPNFSSAEEAAKWTKAQFAGGRVQEVADDKGDCLVVFLHGSGAPVISIGLYRKGASRWNLVLERRPPADASEFLRASTIDGRIVLIGEKTGRTWPLSLPN